MPAKRADQTQGVQQVADENQIDLEDPAVQTAIAAAVEAATVGLKNKNTELLGSLRTTKTELDGFKSQFEGLDIAAVKGLLTKVGQDEETKLIAEGKLDEVITRRTERLRTDYDTKLAVEKAHERRFDSPSRHGRRSGVGGGDRAVKRNGWHRYNVQRR